MNDKILRLIEKSGLEPSEDIEKLIKLTAKECSYVCQLESHAHRMGFGLHCAEMIKGYFGIED